MTFSNPPWDFTPPPPSDLGDHDVPDVGDHLAGRRIALMISGGIAAMKTPLLARALRRQGAEVVAFASQEALRYVASDALEWSTTHPVVTRLSPHAEHLSDASPFDAYLLPQATYNTLNKMATGIADGVITSTLASALGRMERGQAAVLVVPTMHGTMHNSILTESLRRLDRMGVRVVKPREAYGKHNIPEDDVLVAEVCRAVSRSPLRGRRILVTGGPVSVSMDAHHRLLPHRDDRTGLDIARELLLRGADPWLIQGEGAHVVPAFLPHRIVRDREDYRRQVLECLTEDSWLAGVFSATVATAVGNDDGSTKTEPSLVEEAQRRAPDLVRVTVETVASETAASDTVASEAVSSAQSSADAPALGTPGDRELWIVRRHEDAAGEGDEVAWLVNRDASEPRRLEGSPAIARAVADALEAVATQG